MVIKLSRKKSAVSMIIMGLVATWGAFGWHSSGFDHAFRLTALAICGPLTLLLAFLVIRPATVVEIDDSGVRVPRRPAIPWAEVAGMKITFWTGVFPPDRWVRYIFPTWWLRRPLRFLGFIPVPGSGFDKENAGRMRRINGLVPVATYAQLPMELEELASLVRRFAPQLPLEYGPGAKPRGK
ncbi:MAG: hypothetical protein QOG21_2525 [Actinomycetota bacterium]|nr:hypothetical protein [Actinomycetota bacterium]